MASYFSQIYSGGLLWLQVVTTSIFCSCTAVRFHIREQRIVTENWCILSYTINLLHSYELTLSGVSALTQMSRKGSVSASSRAR